jgi:hypothetical protein
MPTGATAHANEFTAVKFGSNRRKTHADGVQIRDHYATEWHFQQPMISMLRA